MKATRFIHQLESSSLPPIYISAWAVVNRKRFLSPPGSYKSSSEFCSEFARS